MASNKSAATTKKAAKKTRSTKKGTTTAKESVRSAKKTAKKSTGSAKKSGAKKTSKGAARKVAAVMHEWKEGTLRSGGSGKQVTSQKQAVAIGLSEARKAGATVPKKAARKGGAS